MVDGEFHQVVDAVKLALKDEGFGVLTEVDIAKTLDEKLSKTFRPYVILGACNPSLAHQALMMEDKLGVMLPCNVIVQQKDGKVEVAAIDPVTSLGRTGNTELTATAGEVKDRLERVVAAVAVS
ncbi:DUF302 domain-containing protein [Parasphingorhabdus sp.]|uniref:DUF302 domain-containing protein n=1 Tax=Parasphingorhabdus sp. TaxID=2709688 RepID=UPI003A9080A0